MTSTPACRDAFNTTMASRIATCIDPALVPGPEAGRSKRFAYFADAHRLLIVAGRQEGEQIDLALAYGLTWARGKRLLLSLPAGHTTATAQRLPWVSDESRPELYEHSDDGQVRRSQVLSREDTLTAVREQSAGDLQNGSLLRSDDAVGSGSPALGQLAELAPSWQLQPAHRPGTYS